MHGQDAFILYEPAGITVFDKRGTVVVEHLWPPPGIRYVGNGRPRGPKPKRTATDVLIHEVSAMS